MLSNRNGLLVCFKKDGFDIVDDELGIEKTGTVDVANVVVGIKKIDFEHMAKETAPVTIVSPELRNRLIEVSQDRIEICL